VFVIEAVETMNDQTANRMLKTLEEPPDFVHLVLLTDRREDVLETIASRCQPVRFDAIPAARIAARLSDAEPEQAQACARLALGDARWAAWLAGEQGRALRASAERFVRAALLGEGEGRPWTGLLEVAKSAGASAGERAQLQMVRELELVPAKEHKRNEREGLEARRRRERRERTRTLDLGLGLVELWLRDLLCVREGVPELIHAVDRRTQLLEDAGAVPDLRLCAAVELVQDTRLRLPLHVSEELALEGLAYRLGQLRQARVS
jgi:DNA polymerase-3 subunit delta'